MPADTQAAAKPSLTLRRRIRAAPARVYAAWTDPTQLTRWFSPAGNPVLLAETDVRVGGRFRIRFESAPGEVNDVSGVYREVVADRKLVFTWAWHSTPERESLVTIDVKPDDDGCVLTLTHEQFFDEKARDDHKGGWTALLDRLDGLLS